MEGERKIMADLLFPVEAGELLGVSAAGARYLEKHGQLRAFRTARGYRVFLRSDVERLVLERAAAKGR